MTQLTEKLERTQCDCDSLNGKTIAKFVRERGYYWLLFTDGTWLFSDYQQSAAYLIESFAQDRYCDNSLVNLGIAAPFEIRRHWEELDEQRDEARTKQRMELYLQLKREFEPQELA